MRDLHEVHGKCKLWKKTVWISTFCTKINLSFNFPQTFWSIHYIVHTCIHSTFCLCSHLMKDTWMVSTFDCCEMLPWAPVRKYLSVSVPAFSPFECIPESGTAGSCGNYIKHLEEPPHHFLQSLHHFTSPPAMHEGANFPASSTKLDISPFFLIIVILMGLKLYLIIVLLCIFLIFNNIEHLFLEFY